MKIFDRAWLDDLCQAARQSVRGRKNYNLHDDLADPIQRLFNALEPGTYVRPHCHDGGRWEVFVLLRGSCAVLIFDGEGRVARRIEMHPQACPVVEIPGGSIHSIIAMEAGSLIFEIKPGPYQPVQDKDFASFAPPEGDPAAADFLDFMRSAQQGDHSPATT